MNTLEKILREIEVSFNENTKHIEDSRGVHHFVIHSSTAKHIVDKIIRSHINEMAGVDVSKTETTGWIPVEERLPEYGAEVLCTEKYTQQIYTGWCDNIRTVGVRWFDSEDFSMEVVAWMPLPEAYKESNDGREES